MDATYEITGNTTLKAEFAATDRESQGGAGDCSTEDGQLRRARYARQFQIGGEDRMPAHVSEQSHGAGGDDHQADCQPVQAVGQVDGVG